MRSMSITSRIGRLDENGDLFDVIKIVEMRKEDWIENVTVIAIRTKDFAEYMRLSDMGMVVIFDFTRTDGRSFHGWQDQERFDRNAPDLFYDGGVMPGHASYAAGRQIVRPAITMEEIIKEHMEARNPSNRQYAVFKAINLRTNERIEVSCDPKGLSNYFQPESNLPLEMSPVFFRGEVLMRYKADPDKYELHDRSIYCRGTWSLRTYDINDAGQVHTYLRYLRDLPYNEQVYWQSFNEWPKGELSKRAITTDSWARCTPNMTRSTPLSTRSQCSMRPGRNGGTLAARPLQRRYAIRSPHPRRSGRTRSLDWISWSAKVSSQSRSGRWSRSPGGR
jgi:hypothetical protein